MEWIRISENKLKIMLTAEDAKRYALPCETVDLADQFTRQAFRDILSDIRHDAGFDATEEKVYIQMYPSKEGGCELFVTKMGLLFNDPTVMPPRKKESGDDTGERPKKSTPRSKKAPRQRTEVCSFPELSAILSVCARLLLTHYAGESTAWKDETGNYWLFLTENEQENHESLPCHSSLFLQPHAFLAEYGKPENTESAKIFLSEHGQCICPVSAVEILGMLQ